MSEIDSVLHAINVYVDPDESKDTQSEAFNNIATFVQANSVNDLIEMLEDQLVSAHDRVRNRATTLLAELFHQLKFDLQGSVLHLYVVFFNHRLSDFPSVIPSLHALTALVQSYGPKFEPKYNDSLDIFQSVFNALHVPAYAQTVRFKVYLLFKAIMTEPQLTSAIESHGVDILEGIVCCMEEEKDPRCLLEVFQVVHFALKLFWHQLNHRVAATSTVSEADNMQSVKAPSTTSVLLSIRIFEALNCYFPITFRPPPNDPFGISSEMLISALEDCLCFTPDAILSGTSDSYSIGIGKRKLSSQEGAVLGDSLLLEDTATSATDVDAMVRLSVPYLLEQLTEEDEEETGPVVTRVHALRALVRIVRTSPHAHRVLGLLPPEEGYNRSSVSNNWDKKVSAQDRQLMDMVGSDDDDVTGCEDLYIQDKAGRTLPESTAPWTAAPDEAQLLTVLRNLADRLFTLLVSKSVSSSAGPEEPVSEETVFALTLVGEIAASIARTEGTASAAWKCFVEPLLSQVSAQLASDAAAGQARAAIDIAYAVARMANKISSSGYAAVLKSLAPLLLQVCETAHTDASALLQRAAQDAVRCITTAATAAAGARPGSAAAPGDEGRLAVGSEMLAQLIDCAGGDNAKTCTHAQHAHPDSKDSCSTAPASALAVEALQPYAVQIFDTLIRFARPQQLQVTAPAENATVNPFLAVKASFGETGAAAGSDKAISEASKAFLSPAPCMLAVVGSITAMRELLQRLPADTFPSKELCTYVRTITDTACYGMSTIVKTDPSVLIVSAEDTRVTSEILYRSCVSFLVSLVDTSTVVGSYSSIVRLHCVDQLLHAASDAKLSCAVQKRVYGLLGALARTCSVPASEPSQAALQGQSVFGLAVCSLTDAVRRSVEMATFADSVDTLQSAALALQTLVDVVPGPVSESSASAISDALKLQLLIRTDVNTADTKSLVLSTIAVISRHITALVSMQQRVAASTDALVALINALYALLRGSTRSMNAADTAIAQHQQQFASDVIRWLLQQQRLEGVCERALTVGLMANALVFLSKDSAVFQSTQSGLLTDAVTYALQFAVYRDNTVKQQGMNYNDYVTVFERSAVLNSFNTAPLLAIIVNKIQEHSQCEEQLLRIITAVSNSSSSDINVEYAADILLYTVKGVCMRKNITISANSSVDLSNIAPYTASSSSSWQEWLMQYIVAALTPAAASVEGDRRVSLAMASQMHILTTDDDIILSQSVISSSNVAMFWKQKLWNRLFTQLSQSAPISHLTSDHLLAICALARGVPVNVLQERLQMLVELVVQSMLRTQNNTDNTAESTLATAALTVQSMCTLEMLLRAEPALFTSYLNIIIPAILKTSHQAKSARLRVTALEGLLAVTEHIPYTRLYPFRTLVSKELLRALDDCKAGVRVLAGRIRNKWLIMK